MKIHLRSAALSWTRSVLAAVLIGSACLAGAAGDPKASQFYEDALLRYQKQDYAGAAIQLKNALRLDRQNLAVQVLLGQTLLQLGEVAAAEVALVEALRLGVNRSEVALPLARALLAQGKQRQVLEDARFQPAGLPTTTQSQLLLLRASALGDLGDNRAALKAIEEARVIAPLGTDTWLAEVPLRIRMRQLAEAQAAADKALSMTPDEAMALYSRGQVAHVQGDLKATLNWYDKALKVQPNLTEALVSRAGLLIDMDRHAEARKDVDTLLKTTPSEPRASYMLALLLERQKDSAGARTAYNTVTNLLDPVPPDVLRYRPQLLMLAGLSHYSLRQFEKARPYLETVQRLQPNSPVTKLLAQIYVAEKNVDAAVLALDAYLRSHPGDAQATLQLASIHMSQRRYARAAQLTEDALKQQDTAGLHTVLGLSLVGRGKYGSAVTELEAAVRKDPSQLQATGALITLYLQSGQTAKAIKLAETQAKAYPRHAAMLHLLGKAKATGGDTTGARAALEAALSLDPKFIAPQVALARLDAATGKQDEAASRLLEVLKRDEKNLEALTELAAILEQRGRHDDAARLLKKADDGSGPTNYQPGLVLVDFYLRTSQPDLARETLTRISGKAPESMPILLAQGRVAIAAGDSTAARTVLTRATSLANYDAPLLLRIALLQMQVGNLSGAAHALSKALQERPDFLPALAAMAEVELQQGEAPKAEQRARQLAAKHPKLAVGHGLLGDIAMSRGQATTALEHYRRAQAVEPSRDGFQRMYRLLARSNPGAAAQSADDWLKRNPKDLAARRLVADTLAGTGNYAAARVAYASLLQISPNDAEALNNLANVLILQKDPGALALAERALAAAPGLPHVLGTAGWAAFQAGKHERALQLLRDARLRDPHNAETRYFLASVLAATGKPEEAKTELMAALQSKTRFASAREAEHLLRTLK